jgi:hypothetical protein
LCFEISRVSGLCRVACDLFSIYSENIIDDTSPREARLQCTASPQPSGDDRVVKHASHEGGLHRLCPRETFRTYQHDFKGCTSRSFFPSNRMITGTSRFVRRYRNQESVKCELHNTYKCCRTVNPTPAFARFRPTSPPCLLGEILRSGPSTSRPSGQFLTFAFMKLGYISWPACYR